MYVKKMCGYVVSANMLCVLTKGRLDSYSPPTQESRTYKNWVAVLDLKTCLECRARHGQIYRMDETPDIEPPLHPNCRCEIKPMDAVIAGQGTKDGQNGADYWMKYFADLPEYYMTENDLRELGWRKGKSPAKFAPGKNGNHGNLPKSERTLTLTSRKNLVRGGHQLLQWKAKWPPPAMVKRRIAVCHLRSL